MAKTLDRSKPFEEIYGSDPAINYRYVQDGVKFDDAGEQIVESKTKSTASTASTTAQSSPTDLV